MFTVSTNRKQECTDEHEMYLSISQTCRHDTTQQLGF